MFARRHGGCCSVLQIEIIAGSNEEATSVLPITVGVTSIHDSDIVTVDATVRRVLLVECEPPREPSAISVLRHAKYQIALARSFGEAKHLIASVIPDLVVTDVRLGPYNGLQLLWQRFFEDPRTAAIVIDEAEDPVTRREAERVGADYLVREQIGEQLRSRAARRLGSSTEELAYGLRRRWIRHRFRGELWVSLGSGRARLCDVSYGGCRIEAPAASAIAEGARFPFSAESWRAPLQAQIRWTRETADGVQCGALLVNTQFEALSLWKASVDAWARA